MCKCTNGFPACFHMLSSSPFRFVWFKFAYKFNIFFFFFKYTKTFGVLNRILEGLTECTAYFCVQISTFFPLSLSSFFLYVSICNYCRRLNFIIQDFFFCCLKHYCVFHLLNILNRRSLPVKQKDMTPGQRMNVKIVCNLLESLAR